MKTLVLILALSATMCVAEDVQTIYQSQHFTVMSDRVSQGSYLARALSRTEMESNYAAQGQSTTTLHWQLRSDISGYPQFQSDAPLIDALYNLSLEELQKDVRPDGTFMAGALWDGVWTRDVSYSILLSLAAIEPETAKRSLMAKVKRDRIVQDTGTGGSWPVSSDRMVWALAAWEIYEVSGDREWLRQSFEIIRNSAADDEAVVFSRPPGLVLGESSFLDWREQTYPSWMNGVDIYSAKALGTNAVHYRTYRILAAMARQLGQPSKHYDQIADLIRSTVNQSFWVQSSGYYGQFLYGREHASLSPRSEALGEALSILFDIADPARQDSVLRSVPVMEYGIPSIYPQTTGIPPYHNNAVWPFVEAFWSLAAAKRHDGTALLEGLASIYRASALFLTNKENFVADTGSYSGTQINSDRQLWSVAGNLAIVYRIFVGMKFTEKGIELHPVVPAELDGTKTLSNFRYRKAVLSFRVQGHGCRIRSMTIDGQPSPALVPADLEGAHEIEIRLANDKLASAPGHRVEPLSVAPAPVVRNTGDSLAWDAVPGVVRYVIYRNGQRISTAHDLSFSAKKLGAGEYQVSGIEGNGQESFLSEPIRVNSSSIIVEAETGAPATKENLTGYSGSGVVELDREINTKVVLQTSIEHAGHFEILFRYSNGSGPINTENKCGIRTLLVDGKVIGPIVMPQRGVNQWSNWGLSSGQIVALSKGRHSFELQFAPQDENMNPSVNRVMLDAMQILTVD